MNQKTLLAIIALLGLAVSGYLFITHVSSVQLICGEEGGCHTVQASQYASHFGIPTAAYGVLFYAILGILAALEKRPLLKLFTLTGLLVSAYLTYLEAFVVEAWCVWCVVSAILATAAFLIVWLDKFSQESNSTHTKPQLFTADSMHGSEGGDPPRL